MKVEEKLQILKFFIIVFNGFFVILGLALFGCGIWILFDKSTFVVFISAGNSVKTVAGVLFAVGLIIVGISALGCVGSAKEIGLCVILHMAFLLPLVVVEVFITCMVLINRDTVSAALFAEMDAIIAVYGNDSASAVTRAQWQIVDLLQQYSGCCGRMNYTQWQSSNAYILSLHEPNTYPCSCFNTTLYGCPVLSGSSAQRFGQGSAVYQTGCQKTVEDWLLGNGLAVVLTNIFLIVIEALQLGLGISFFLVIGKQERKVLPELQSSRVNYSAFHNQG